MQRKPSTFQFFKQEENHRLLSSRWIIFGVVSLAYLFVFFHRLSTAVMAQDLIDTFLIDASALGVLGSAYFYPYALMQFPAGMLADTYGSRRLIALSAVVSGIGAVLFSLSPAYPWAVASRFIIGLGLSCIYVPTLKLLAVWFKPNEYATAFGFLLALGNAGALLAATPLAVMLLFLGWRYSVLLIGVLTILIGFLVYYVVRDQPQEDSSGDSDLKKRAQEKVHPWQGMGIVLKEARFWPLTIRGIAFYGVLMSFQSLWAGPYLRQVAGADTMTAGNILMMISIGTILSSPISGLLSDKILKTRKGITVLSMVLSTLCWLPLALFPERLTIHILYVVFFLFGFVGGLGAAAMAQLKELFPSSLAGTVNGVFNGIVMLSGALYQVLFGFLLQTFSLTEIGYYPPEAYIAGFRWLLLSLMVGTIAMLFSQEGSNKKFEKVDSGQ